MAIVGKKHWLTFLSFFIILNTLFFYGFIRDGTWAVIAVLLIPICYKISRINFFLSANSFLFTTLFLIWVVDFGFPNLFYEFAYDRLITRIDYNVIKTPPHIPGTPIYKKNKTVDMIQPSGHLRALANKVNPDDGHVLEYEPRKIIFKTDSLGFRNNSNYNAQPFVLVGDSFIAGSANTQKHTLSSVLKDKYKVNTYSMGVAGADLEDYLTYIKMLEGLYKSPFKVLLFVYESNDFPKVEPEKTQEPIGFTNFHKKPIKLYKKFFRQTGLYRYTWMGYKSITNRYKDDKFSRIQINKIGNHLIGFGRNEIRQAHQNEYIPPPIIEKTLKSLKDKILHIYYIPEKYRIYYPLIYDADKVPLPNATWEKVSSITKKLEIPITNLGPVFIREAKRYFFEKNQFIYWKDDEHWNIKGVSLAAKVMCQTIKELKCIYN
jgi:hypothetical protein